MSDDNNKISTFTTEVITGLSNRLINMSTIIANGRQFAAKSLWDTGATTSCISTDVVSALGLEKIDNSIMSTPSGEKEVGLYKIDIILPNDFIVNNIFVMESEIKNQGIDIIIGMDIIQTGDFAVTNYDGKTVFSFRIPSIGKIDFVEDLNRNKIEL